MGVRFREGWSLGSSGVKSGSGVHVGLHPMFLQELDMTHLLQYSTGRITVSRHVRIVILIKQGPRSESMASKE